MERISDTTGALDPAQKKMEGGEKGSMPVEHGNGAGAVQETTIELRQIIYDIAAGVVGPDPKRQEERIHLAVALEQDLPTIVEEVEEEVRRTGAPERTQPQSKEGGQSPHTEKVSFPLAFLERVLEALFIRARRRARDIGVI